MATDQVKDSPTNNFCTWNPISGNGSSLSEGNLKANGQLGATKSLGWLATIAPDSGKWYWEVNCVTTGWEQWIGVMALSDPEVASIPTRALNLYFGLGTYSYYQSGTKIEGAGFGVTNTAVAYGNSWTNGDIIGIALDLDDGAIYFSKNGTWQNSGDPTSGASKTGAAFTSFSGRYAAFGSGYRFSDGTESIWTGNWGQDSSFAGAKTAQGNQDENEIGDFYYTPPSGFLALCSSNLPAPSIKKPGVNFNTILYDDGAGAKTGVGFQPDLVWVKSRGSTYEHEWTDAVRGVTEALSSDSTNAETTDSTGLTAFGTDGFTVGADTNYSDTTGSGMVAWSWKAGTTFDPATAGSVVTGSGSSNATAGFSTVGYEGTGSAMTIGHGLSQAPDLIIVKNRDAADAWQVYCSSNTAAPETDYLVLNTDAATVDNVDRWNDTAPTSSVFTVGDGVEVNTDDENYIAYCFHSIEGYSKVGSYEGNGNADGSFVYTGFRPAFDITKSIDSTSNWQLFDNKREGYNVDNYELGANDNAVEDTSTEFIDIVSNGFKNRIATDPNVAETYLYIAFAESPFKYANAR